MMQKIMKITMAVAFAAVAICIFIGADDSDASIDYKDSCIEKDVKYDLCEDNGFTYGYKYVAFASSGGDEYNRKYTGKELTIVPTVVKGGVQYTVVGIRNDAFKSNASLAVTAGTLEKVTLPETLVAIGVSNEYKIVTSGGGYVFSGCSKLSELVIEGKAPKLQYISIGAFKNTNLEEIDFSHCQGLRISNNAFEGNHLKRADISSAIYVGEGAFYNGGVTDLFIMPKSLVSEIHGGAFPDNAFYDANDTKIYHYSLRGKIFMKDPLDYETYLHQAFVATFDTGGGDVLAPYYCYAGEDLPTATRGDNHFLGWAYSNEILDKMPAHNVHLTARWSVDRPDSSIAFEYDGTVKSPFTNPGYFVSSGIGSAREAGLYDAVLTLADNTVWSSGIEDGTHDISWRIESPAVQEDTVQKDKVQKDTVLEDNYNAVYEVLPESSDKELNVWVLVALGALVAEISALIVVGHIRAKP